MARLSGMSTESFSSARERLSLASIGLGSILRDQKAIPVASRMNVLLGLSSHTSPAASRNLLNLPVHLLTSSPIESNNGFPEVDDAEPKDEDACGTEMRESGSVDNLDPVERHRLSQLYDLVSTRGHANAIFYHGYGPPHSHNHKLGVRSLHPDAPKHSRMHLDAPKHGRVHLAAANQCLSNGMDRTSSPRNLGLNNAILTASESVRLSSLPEVADSKPPCSYKTHPKLTASWSIPRVGKCTLHDSRLVEHQSAPVNVPNWPRLVGKGTTRALNANRIVESTEEEEEEWLPPHVMLAKEYAHSQRMTSSVCEGQGRTLKGRDMRRVRNAVWRQTGFAD